MADSGFGRDHAGLGPRPPADDDEVAFGGAALGEGIEEGVGGAIIDLAIRRRQRADGGEEGEKIERVGRGSTRRGFRGPRSFGASTLVGDVFLFELDDAVLKNARGVDDAVERAEFFVGQVSSARWSDVAVRHVGGEDQHFRAELAPFRELIAVAPASFGSPWRERRTSRAR